MKTIDKNEIITNVVSQNSFDIFMKKSLLILLVKKRKERKYE